MPYIKKNLANFVALYKTSTIIIALQELQEVYGNPPLSPFPKI